MPLAASSIVSLLHLVGVVLAAGAATVKLVLLLRCGADPALVPAYLQVARPITRLIIAGMIVLALSGVGWLVLGYAITPRLIVKLILFAAIWVLGPVIDNVIEPRFRALAPAAGAAAGPGFASIRRQYVTWEIVATSLFYVIVALWTIRT